MVKTVIKSCCEEDLAVIQKLGRETYDETFRSMNTPLTMKKYLDEAFCDEKLLSELRNPASRFFFVYSDNRLSGYLKINFAPAQSDINDPDSLEIERIYVKGEYKGRGIGKKLMNYAIDLASAEDKKYVWLGVWEKNESAIGFYKKSGFTEKGRHGFRMGDEIQTDLILERPVKI